MRRSVLGLCVAASLAGCGGGSASSAHRPAHLPGLASTAPALTRTASSPATPTPPLVTSGVLGAIFDRRGGLVRRVLARIVTRSGDSPSGRIDLVASDHRGGWWVAGQFAGLDGTRVEDLARLSAAGAVDRRWRPRIVANVSALAGGGRTVYVATGSLASGATAQLRAVTAGSGAARGRVVRPGGLVTSMTVLGRRLIVGLARASGRRSCLREYLLPSLRPARRFHGRVTESARSGACVQQIAIDRGHLYVAGGFDRVDGVRRDDLVRLDALSGALDRGWRPPRLGTAPGRLAISGGDVYLDAGGDRVEALHLRTGRRDRRFRADAVGEPLLAVAGRLLVSTSSGASAYRLPRGSRSGGFAARGLMPVAGASSGGRVLLGALSG